MVLKISRLPATSNFIADHAKFLDIQFPEDNYDNFLAIRLDDEEEGIPSYIPHVIRRIGISEILLFCVHIDDDNYSFLSTHNHSQYDSKTLFERFQFIVVDDQYVRENELSNLQFTIDAKFNTGSSIGSSNEKHIRKVYLWDAVNISNTNSDGSNGSNLDQIKKIFPCNSLLFTLRPTEYVSAKFTLKELVGLSHSKATAGLVTYRFNHEVKSYLEYKATAESEGDDVDVNQYYLNYETIDEISKTPLSVDMAFESFNKIPAWNILPKAIDIMINKLQNVRTTHTVLENSKFFKIEVKEEEHTLGSFLEQFIMTCLRQDFMDQLHECTCFYRKPYENKNYIHFTLKLPNNSKDSFGDDINKEYFDECVQKGIDLFTQIKQSYDDMN